VTMTIQTSRLRRGEWSGVPLEDTGSPDGVALLICALRIDPGLRYYLNLFR